MSDKNFKVMWPYNRKEVTQYTKLECPRFVPWSLVEPHERQALSNHDQTFQRLHERGGLDPAELLAVLEGKCWSKIEKDIEVIISRLKVLLANHLSAVKK